MTKTDALHTGILNIATEALTYEIRKISIIAERLDNSLILIFYINDTFYGELLAK